MTRVFADASAVLADPRHRRARKRPLQFEVSFARADSVVATLEGAVPVAAGDAVVTGLSGERWPVARTTFHAGYRPVPPVVAGSDGLYQSLPREVLALRVGQHFDVALANGGVLHGRPGDWLIDHGDGGLGLVAAQLFDALYELIA